MSSYWVNIEGVVTLPLRASTLVGAVLEAEEAITAANRGKPKSISWVDYRLLNRKGRVVYKNSVVFFPPRRRKGGRA
jgi:hypothetical protein